MNYIVCCVRSRDIILRTANYFKQILLFSIHIYSTDHELLQNFNLNENCTIYHRTTATTYCNSNDRRPGVQLNCYGVFLFCFCFWYQVNERKITFIGILNVVIIVWNFVWRQQLLDNCTTGLNTFCYLISIYQLGFDLST